VISRFTWERNKKETQKEDILFPAGYLIGQQVFPKMHHLDPCDDAAPSVLEKMIIKEHHQQNPSARLLQIQNYSWWMPILSLIVTRKREKGEYKW
jgi:hypothetical protein